MNRLRHILSESATLLHDEGISGYISKVFEKIRRHEFATVQNPAISPKDLPLVARIASDFAASCSQLSDTTMLQELRTFLRSEDSRLEFPTNKNPLVSVVIVSYNKAHYLMRCLQNLLNSSILSNMEVIVVDNASKDQTDQLLAKTKNVNLIRNDINQFYAPACNIGAKIARGQYLLFLNQDAFVHASCIASLVATVASSVRIAAAGAKIMNQTGGLLEAGSIVWKNGTAYGYGRGDKPQKPEYCYPRDVDYCSATCLLVRRQFFAELDGFDPKFAPAYYEDTDLCLRMWEAGLRIIFQPSALAVHVEFGSSSFEKARTLMLAQRRLFLAKHKQALEEYFQQNHRNVANARDRCREPALLVVDDCIPKPSDGSGYPRMYRLLKTIATLGYRITFLPLSDPRPRNPETDELTQLGIEVLWGDITLRGVLRDRRDYYDLAIVSRPLNAARSFRAIRKYNANCQIIYDAEALWYRREELKRTLGIISVDRKFLQPQSEQQILRKADYVISVSGAERQIIDKIRDGEGKSRKTIVWGHPHDLAITSAPWEDRNGLLFVGGFKSAGSPNEDAATYFVEHLLPRIQKAIPECRLFIVGSNPPETVKGLASQNVIVSGYVNELERFYDRARVFVAPMRLGAGVMWKVTEAMSFGVPCVASEVAAEGVEGRLLVASDDDDFVNKTIKLYSDRSLWEETRRRGIEYVRNNCDPTAMTEAMGRFLLNVRQGA